MKLKQKKHQQIPGIIQEKVATPETPQTDWKIRTETDEPAPTDKADQIPETDQDQETEPHPENQTNTHHQETETQEAEAVNLTEATEVTETDQQAETDHLIATDIQIQAAAADTDQAAETDTQETEHLLIIGHRPPRLVQRCNGTTAGLGLLEVIWVDHAKNPSWAVNLCPHYHAVGYGQSEW